MPARGNVVTIALVALSFFALVAPPAAGRSLGVPNIANPGEFTPDRWQFWHDWTAVRKAAFDYGHALKFAECVSALNRGALDRVLSLPLDNVRQRSDLVRLAARYRGCGQRVAVAPFLVRAAFAEMRLRSIDGRHTQPTRVGVPTVIRGFPVAAIAKCQVRAAPRLITKLLSTRPGSAAEEQAAAQLYSAAPQCAALAQGTITPTAVRLAVIDAALNRSP